MEKTEKLIDLDFMRGLRECGIDDKVLKGMHTCCNAIINDCKRFEDYSYAKFIEIVKIQGLVTAEGNFASPRLEVRLDDDVLIMTSKQKIDNDKENIVETKYLMSPVAGVEFERYEIWHSPVYIERLYQRGADLVSVIATSRIEGHGETVVEGLIPLVGDLIRFDLLDTNKYSPKQIEAIKHFYRECLMQRVVMKKNMVDATLENLIALDIDLHWLDYDRDLSYFDLLDTNKYSQEQIAGIKHFYQERLMQRINIGKHMIDEIGFIISQKMTHNKTR